MDPISALSLVANIFGVISFAGDVVQLASQIHEHGTSEQLALLEHLSNRLESAVTELTSNPNASAHTLSGTLSKDDAEVAELSRTSTRVSARVAQLMDDVRGGKGRQWPSKLQTVRQTFKTIWNRDTAKKLEDELSNLRRELQWSATISIRAKLDKQSIHLDEALSTLDDRTKEMLTSFLANFDEISAKCDVILTNQSHGADLASTRHTELVNSLNEIRGTGSQSPWPELDEKQIKEVEEAIVYSLWFPLMNDREEMIHDAHKKTFDWIFSDPGETGQPWDDFGKFLRQSSGAYWMSGKAGSGKSTLMKYISRHERTRSLLREWSGPRTLVMATFHFYYLGSQLQKSEIGVLRSLLYQILDTNRHLIPLAFPERFKTLWLSKDRKVMFEPSTVELKGALTSVVRSPSLSLFLAIDGLDEYDADHAGMSMLVTILKDLSGYPNVKALLSSRPWIVFEEGFQGCPQLQLHELTRHDMINFVNDKFKQHPRVRSLSETANMEAKMDSLIRDLVNTSCGVFLWVFLVVQSVLEGISNDDTIADLRASFEDLPFDLDQLYRRMWDRIKPQYRQQAARLLLLVEAGGQGRIRLSLLSLHFADRCAETGLDFVFSAPVGLTGEGINPSEIQETMRRRLLSRCLGLLEIRQCPPEDLRYGELGGGFDSDVYHTTRDKAFKYCHVVFLHKSVHEFISSIDMGPKLQTAAAGSGNDFCPITCILGSALMRMKTLPYDASDQWDADGPIWTFQHFPHFITGFV